jgi:hypothetical protein
MKHSIKKILILIFFISFLKVNAQKKNEFSIGISSSYRIYTGSVFFAYSFLNTLRVTMTFSDGKYCGFGIGAGISWYPILNTKIKPFFSTYYLRTLGNRFSYDRGNNTFTTFQTQDANYIIPLIGFRYDDKGGDKRYKNYFSYIIELGYKISNSVNPKVNLENGPTYPDEQSKIEGYINNSFVASLSLVYNIP